MTYVHVSFGLTAPRNEACMRYLQDLITELRIANQLKYKKNSVILMGSTISQIPHGVNVKNKEVS